MVVKLVNYHVFQNLFPERGLKLDDGIETIVASIKFFRTYSPKGDWNHAQSKNCAMWSRRIVFQNLFPERGLKRLWMVVFGHAGTSKFFRTYSPKGDWNITELWGMLGAICPHSFSEPIPRKGTETGLITMRIKLLWKLFFRTYSPKGDWNASSGSLWSNGLWSVFFRTYSPKGDWNFITPHAVKRYQEIQCFSEPIPRKGTETSAQ